MTAEALDITALVPLLRPRQRLMGADLGAKTIGLALSDVERRIATPLVTIRRTKFAKDAAWLVSLMNQFDAAATDLSSFFTDQPDFTPYTALPSDTRIFDPAKVREPGLELNARPSAPLDDPATIRRELRLREKQVE